MRLDYRIIAAALIAAGALFSEGAEAHASKSSELAPVFQDVTVDIPVSSVQEETPPTREETSGQTGFAISSWSPSRLETPSRIEGATPFRANGIPALSFAYWSRPLARIGGGGVCWRAGVSLLTMTREAPSVLGAASQNAQQSLVLLPGELGVEYAWPVLKSGELTPYADFSLMPTLAGFSRSMLAEGEVRGGFGYAIALGAGSSLGWLGLKSAALDLAWMRTSGSVGSGGDMAGNGVWAGLRFQGI